MTDMITTQRLVLRRFCDEDATAVATLINNWSVVQWLTRVPYPYTVNDALDFFELSKNGPGVHLAISLNGEVIGCISNSEELGYWLGEPFWGQGFASEAARAMVDMHFAQTDAVLGSGYILGNTASCKMLTRLGFLNSDRIISTCLSRDDSVTVQKMVLNKDAWEAVAA